MNPSKTSGRSKTKTPSKKQENHVRRSPRKKQPDSHEKGRRKLEFNKEKKLQKERLKGFIVFVDVPNASAKQKEIKEKVTNLGGKIEEFLDKKVNLVITSRKPLPGKQNGQTAENSPLLGPSPQAMLSAKNSIKCSPYSTDSPQYSADGTKRENRAVSRSQMLVNRVLSNKKGAGFADIWGTAKNIGAKVIPADDFIRKYMAKKLANSITDENMKSIKRKSLNSSLRNSSTSKTLSDIKVNKAVVPCFKIEDKSFVYQPIIHEFKVWPEVCYETSLNQSPFDVPKIKTKSKPRLETPCEQPSSGEETVSLAIKSEKMSETGPEDDGKLKKKSNDNRNGEKPGYCDCCSLRFKELKKHLRSDSHRRFATNQENFKNLDCLINQGTQFKALVNDLNAISRMSKMNQELFPSSSSGAFNCTTSTQSTSLRLESGTSTVLANNNTACGKRKETLQIPFPTLCSPIKNSPQKQKLVTASPRRSPRINRYPMTRDDCQSPLKTPNNGAANSYKTDTTFLYQVVSSTPAKPHSSPVVTYGAVRNLTMIADDLISSTQMTSNANGVTSAPLNHADSLHNIPSKSCLLPSASPSKIVLNEIKGEENIDFSDNRHIEKLRLPSITTSQSESEKPIRKVKKRRKHSHRSCQSTENVDGRSQRSSQIHDEVESSLMKPVIINAHQHPDLTANINEDTITNINIDNTVFTDNNPLISNDCSKEHLQEVPKQEVEILINTDDRQVPRDFLSQTHDFNASPPPHSAEQQQEQRKLDIDEWSDPEVTINTNSKVLHLGKVSLKPCNQGVEETEGEPMSEVFSPTKEDVQGIEIDEKDETDLLLKSYAEENFSSDPANNKENTEHSERKSEPCFLGFTDPEIMEEAAYCDIENCSNEHPEKENAESINVDNGVVNVTDVAPGPGDRNIEPTIIKEPSEAKYENRKSSIGIDFSDDDDANNEVVVKDFEQQLTDLANNMINVKEFQSVDDISVAILKQGSTPKKAEMPRTRTRNRSTSLTITPNSKCQQKFNTTDNQQPPLSPTVITGHSTPLKRGVCALPTSSPLACKGFLRSRRTSSSDQSAPVVNLNNNKNKKKRRATTPLSARSRKRSRTSISDVDNMNQQQQWNEPAVTTTTISCLTRLDPLESCLEDVQDDVFENEPPTTTLLSGTQRNETLTEPLKTPEQVSSKVKSKKKKKKEKSHKLNVISELPACMNVDLTSALFGGTLSDRIKRRSRPSSTSNSTKSSSSKPCSPALSVRPSPQFPTAMDTSVGPDVVPPPLPRRSPRKRKNSTTTEEWVCSSPCSDRFKLKIERKKKYSPFENTKGISKHSNVAAILEDFDEFDGESTRDVDVSTGNTAIRKELLSSRTVKETSSFQERHSTKKKSNISSFESFTSKPLSSSRTLSSAKKMKVKKKTSETKKHTLKFQRGKSEKDEETTCNIVSDFENHEDERERSTLSSQTEQCTLSSSHLISQHSAFSESEEFVSTGGRPRRKCKNAPEGIYWEEEFSPAKSSSKKRKAMKGLYEPS